MQLTKLSARDAEQYLINDAPMLMTPSEIAPIVGKHPDTIRLWCKAGTLPSVQPAGKGHHLIRRADVAALVGVELN